MRVTPAIALGQWITERADRAPQRKALSFEDATWTYAEFVDHIDRLAAVLRQGGVARGDRVGFLAFNHPLFLVTLFAASRLGAIFVPLNFRLTGPELEFIINDAGVHSLIVGPDHQAVIGPVRPALRCQRYYGFGGKDGRNGAEAWPDLAGFMAECQPLRDAAELAEDDVAALMYTSGTTGHPKGSMMTVGNIWWNMVSELVTVDISSNDVLLTYAPLFHVGGLNVLTLSCLLKGVHVVLHPAFDPARVIADVPRHGVSLMFAVPAMLLFISQHPDFERADMSTVRSIMVGGAPCPETLLRLFNERGIAVNQGYGLTETAAMASFLTPEWCWDKMGSVGKPPILTRMRLIDADGKVITAPHVKGEVCVRGMNVTLGYWNRPDATRDAIDPDGWFRTGDIGYVDEDGFYTICDRVKDMVISGGENVYPAEVESVLYEHPAIAEVAVIGQPDETWGEKVVAVVALKPGARLDLEALQAFAGSRLARYKVPRQLRIVPGLPRNPTGKVLKYRLREQVELALPE
ncbi:acyl-CoA synthetase [Noviherbaspirillum galbum]|uniref:Long-chain fatty acid--CoA ligase n=1 Tax=Noviherbaspirillum galbum TaxID=2709383 RepID=A0A6B3SST8_9BURK|nr:long-chain fatty acid--CoA ligase [Noviherbaspirillum galbum]NEX63721.1 long-chain fatty acid--CoA ligase [Noviherbaspirillum galbum]